MRHRTICALTALYLLFISVFGCSPADMQGTGQTSGSPSASPSVSAEPTALREPLQIVGQIGGQTRCAAVSGGMAYVGVGYKVTIVDVSSPEALRELGSTEYLDGDVRDITVEGSVAYIAAGEAGLIIVDVSDPASPEVVCRYDTAGYAEGVAVSGETVFLADGPSGIIAFDASKPGVPVVKSSAYERCYAFDIALKDGYAYIAAAGAGMLVVDVSDSAGMREVSELYLPGYAYGIAVRGDAAYVADGWEGLRSVDISDPSQPTEQGTFDTHGWAMDAVCEDNQLYVACAIGGLRVYDVSPSGALYDRGYFAVDNSHFESLAVAGNIVYAADIRQGMHIIDAADAQSPVRAGLYSPIGYAQAVEVSGGYAYVAAQNYGVRAIDVSNPVNPREVGVFDFGNQFATITVAGNTAYAATSFGGDAGTEQLLYAIDISDPLNIGANEPVGMEGKVTGTTITEYEVPDRINMISRHMTIADGMLYNSGEKGFVMMNLSDPVNPVAAGLFLVNVEPSGQDIACITCADAQDGYVYLAAQNDGMYVVGASDPENMKLVGRYYDENAGTKGMTVSDVAVSGAYAYIMDNNRLRAIDISDPSAPKLASLIELPAFPLSGAGHSSRTLLIDGDTIFIADAAAGLVAVDISDPANMTIVQQLSINGHVCWLCADESFIYAAAEEGGVYIIAHGGDAPEAAKSREAVALAAIPGAQCESQYEPLPLLSLNTGGLAREGGGRTITVTSTADDGNGSLRRALSEARTGDTVVFDTRVFPKEDPGVIYALSSLWLTADGVTVDASRAGVVIDGSKASSDADGFNLKCSFSAVRGLAIRNFYSRGLWVCGRGNVIGGDPGKGEGNVIALSGLADVVINTAFSTLITGNIIGLDALGEKRISNENCWGLVLQSGAGANMIMNNTISGYSVVADPQSWYNEFTGNRIGTDATGTKALDGVHILSVGLQYNRVGGTQPNEGNIIGDGIDLGFAQNHVVIGNIIGLDAAGERALPTGSGSIGVNDSRHIFIGGATEKERNLLCDSDGVCLRVYSGSRNIFILSNRMGADKDGNPLGCGRGVSIEGSTANIIVQGNLIAGAAEAGIEISGSGGNTVRGNALVKSNDGVRLNSSNGNLFLNNLFQEISSYCIVMFDAADNLICGNAFISGGMYGCDKSGENAWDDGERGNYWDIYEGTDADGDGVGDTPFVYDVLQTDNYPLMEAPQFIWRDIAG